MKQIKTKDASVARTHEILIDNGIYVDDMLTHCEYGEEYLRDLILEKNEKIIIECQDWYSSKVFILDSKDEIDDVLADVFDYLPESDEIVRLAHERMEEEGSEDWEKYTYEIIDERCEGDGMAYATVVNAEDVEKLLEDDRLCEIA